jgi:small-conductance mechanosensitive channel
MYFVTETGQALLNPLMGLWNSFVTALPGFIGALIVLIVGYIIAWAIGFVVTRALHQAKLDKFAVEKTTLDKVVGKFELSHLIGLIVKWYVFVLFLTPAAYLINLAALSEFLVKASLWIPNLIAAVLIALVGLVAADYVSAKVHEVKAKASSTIAAVVRVIVIIFTLIIALSQLGIDVSIAENSFLIILAGIMLALAIGFGLALKDEVKPLIKKIKGQL